jgi:hypothetical protein
VGSIASQLTLMLMFLNRVGNRSYNSLGWLDETASRGSEQFKRCFNDSSNPGNVYLLVLGTVEDQGLRLE